MSAPYATPRSPHLDHEARVLIAKTAMQKMFRDGYLDICCIDRIADLFDVSVRGSDAHNALRALHCVRFSSMPAELQKKIGPLIQECFGRVLVFMSTSDGGFVVRESARMQEPAQETKPPKGTYRSFWSNW